jgi:hypothetical protein
MLLMAFAKKYTTIIATVLLATAAAPALAQDGNSGPFDGFYAGGEIGAVHSNSKAVVTPATGAAVSAKSDKTIANYGVFAGYGTTFAERFYVSTELELNSGGGKSKTAALGGINTAERINYEGAVSTRAGYMVNDENMIYALVGSVRRESKFTIGENRVRTATVSGSRFGIGWMQECLEDVFIRAELEQTEFNKKSFAVATQPTTGYESKATTLSVGIAYRF